MKTADLLRHKQIDNEYVATCERDGHGVELLPDPLTEPSESVTAEIERLAILEIIH